MKMLSWQWSRCWGCHPRRPEMGYAAFTAEWFKPCHVAEVLDRLRADPATAHQDHVFWLGHATTLLCLHSGTNIIFDPIFSDRCSPFSWIGPKRRNAAGTTVEDLPTVHIITISHNHYDHLDEASVKALHSRFPEVRIVVPLGMERNLITMGIDPTTVTTLDWQDEVRICDVVVACTPAQHWGQRWLCDRNEVLWCGWCIGWEPPQAPQGNGTCETVSPDQITAVPPSGGTPTSEPAEVNWASLKSYYFTGDTAWNEDVFRLIQARHHHIDMAALPIGAYAPRWFMSSQHIDPEHAVLIFQTLKARRGFGVHWATFELADDPLDEPPQVLREAVADAGLQPELFVPIPIGAPLSF